MKDHTTGKYPKYDSLLGLVFEFLPVGLRGQIVIFFEQAGKVKLIGHAAFFRDRADLVA